MREDIRVRPAIYGDPMVTGVSLARPPLAHLPKIQPEPFEDAAKKPQPCAALRDGPSKLWNMTGFGDNND
jgi:hypothetical protein